MRCSPLHVVPKNQRLLGREDDVVSPNQWDPRMLRPSSAISNRSDRSEGGPLVTRCDSENLDPTEQYMDVNARFHCTRLEQNPPTVTATVNPCHDYDTQCILGRSANCALNKPAYCRQDAARSASPPLEPTRQVLGMLAERYLPA